MSELGRYLAVYYLPHAEMDVLARYGTLARSPGSAAHLSSMHLFMWKMALTDDGYDLQKIRNLLLRRTADPDEILSIDDLVVRRMAGLIQVYGADQKAALQVEVAMALAAVNVTSVMTTAA